MLRTVTRGLAVVVVLAGASGCTGTRAGAPQGSEQCTFCHGDPGNFPGDNVLSAAPPRALEREHPETADRLDRTATINPGVGAHQAHLREGPLTRAVRCTDCHVVPNADGQDYSDVLFHIGGTNTAADATPGRADLSFAGRAVLGGVQAGYDYAGHGCQTYCHGVTLSGGANPAPIWNKVGEGQADCGACHGLPPTKPGHPQSTSCHRCHPTVDADLNIIDKDRHIDGTVDLSGAACSSCHGSDVNPAPPVDTQGRSETTLTSVGAHQAHLRNGTYSDPIACAECHLVPTDLTHIDGTAEVIFGTLAGADGASPAWNGTTCQAYCHGQTISGGSNKTPDWTAGSGQAQCGTCHSLPPTGSHDPVGASSCAGCHGMVINADMTWNNKSLHINGVVNVVEGTDCNACHDAPPQTGSHLKHFAGTLAQVAYGDPSITAGNATSATPDYIYGCGNCHPLDPAKHRNGVVDIELYDAAAPAGTLKQRHPATASYTPGGTTLTDGRGFTYTLGTCGDVYCHSGRSWTTPGGVPRPGIDFAWGGAYPIVYPQPVDSYVQVTRTYKSVTWGAASPGCGGCHGNPPQTSTAGGNAAGAGDSHSFLNGSAEVLHNHFSAVMGAGSVACRGCHINTVTAATPAVADARYHVNGTNDVAFDPGHTYSVMAIPQSLAGASYNPTTRICSVACHDVDRTDQPRWGDPYRTNNQPECLRCHNGVIP